SPRSFQTRAGLPVRLLGAPPRLLPGQSPLPLQLRTSSIQSWRRPSQSIAVLSSSLSLAGSEVKHVPRGSWRVGFVQSISRPRTSLDNPHPCQAGFPRIPILPGSGRRPRRRPALVFPGRSLGLGRTSRYVEGRKRFGGKGNASPYQVQRRILWLNVSTVSNGRMGITMRKKTWTVIAVANDTRHLWSCLQKATDAHDAMRQCAAEMGAVDPSNFQIIGAIRGDHDVIASGEDGGPRSGH